MVRIRKGFVKDGDIDFDSTWDILATALQEIHTKNASKLSFEELYRNAYKLVLKKKADDLYERVSRFEEVWLRDNVRVRVTAFVTPSIMVGSMGQSEDLQSNERRAAGERFMRALKDAFEDHTLCMSMITDVLMYMDRVYCQDQRKPSIFITAMMLFRIHVLQTPFAAESTMNVLAVLESVVLDLIRMERSGEIVDRSLIRACCYMLEGLYMTYSEDESSKLYLTSFEPKFLDASRIFYRAEGQAFLANADASTFCSQARRRLQEEEERCQQALSMLTEPKIKSVVDTELISVHIKDVINMEATGVRYMLDNDKTEDLRNVYDLIARVDHRRVALKEAVQKRVRELGMEINRNASVEAGKPAENLAKPADKHGPERPVDRTLNQATLAAVTWLEDILKLKAKYDRIWEESFLKDGVMEKALEVACQDFINANEQSPEHLSLFLDEYLKKGSKNKSEEEIDTLLDKGIILLQYIADKDRFETYYKKHMAKRLLMMRSSRDMERQLISKMKMKIGNTFTQKLEGLLKDMNLSDDTNAQYKESLQDLDADAKRIDINARILTSNVWPFDHMAKTENDDGTPRLPCIYPAEIEQLRLRFQRFYLNKHSGRKLFWTPGLGDADVMLTLGKDSKGRPRRHLLNVSTYAMIILLLFNDLPNGECLTCDEIVSQTNIPRHELVRNLQSLALNPKTKFLRKEPMSKDVKPDDKFFFNETFKSDFFKIKVGVVASGSNKVENSEERRETQKRVDEERGVTIEAAIVRIMKQRKTLSHQQLMSETIQQLTSRFQPDVNMIKKKIESLIDREYLERGLDLNKPSYTYLA